MKNVFVKPNEQSEACFDSAMARKRRMKSNVFANGLLFVSIIAILACSGKSSTSTVTTETETTITGAATEELEEPYKGDLAMFWLSDEENHSAKHF